MDILDGSREGREQSSISISMGLISNAIGTAILRPILVRLFSLTACVLPLSDSRHFSLPACDTNLPVCRQSDSAREFQSSTFQHARSHKSHIFSPSAAHAYAQAVTDIIQFIFALLLALLPAVYVAATKGTRPLTRLDQLYKFLVKFPFGNTLFSLMVGIASPYNASIRPRFLKVEQNECIACLQDRPWLRNPFASLHAAALFNLAEMISGIGMLTAAQYEKGCRYCSA